MVALGWVSRPLPQPALVLVVRGCGASDCVVSSSEAGVSSTQLVLSIAWGEAVLISWVLLQRVWNSFWLWGATVLWTLGFDTGLRHERREDDDQHFNFVF